jgi:hypothetical protein
MGDENRLEVSPHAENEPESDAGQLRRRHEEAHQEIIRPSISTLIADRIVNVSTIADRSVHHVGPPSRSSTSKTPTPPRRPYTPGVARVNIDGMFQLVSSAISRMTWQDSPFGTRVHRMNH